MLEDDSRKLLHVCSSIFIIEKLFLRIEIYNQCCNTSLFIIIVPKDNH